MPALPDQIVIEKQLKSNLRTVLADGAEEFVSHILGIGISDLHIVFPDFACLVVHNADFTGAETIEPVDEADEAETLHCPDVHLLQADDPEAVETAVCQEFEVPGDCLDDIFGDDFLRDKVPAAHLGRVELRQYVRAYPPLDCIPARQDRLQADGSDPVVRRLVLRVQVTHCLVEDISYHSGIQILRDFVTPLQAFDFVIIEHGRTVEIFLECRG